MTKQEALNQLQELIEDHKNFIGNENQLTDYKKDIEAIEYLIEENKRLEEQLKQKDEAIDEAIKYIQYNMSYTEIRKWIDIGKFEIASEDILDEEMINELLEILQKYKGDNNGL